MTIGTHPAYRIQYTSTPPGGSPVHLIGIHVPDLGATSVGQLKLSLRAESTDLAARRAVGLAMTDLWATVEEADEDFVRADLAFHRAVFVAAGNDLLLHVHDQVEAAMGSDLLFAYPGDHYN